MLPLNDLHVLVLAGAATTQGPGPAGKPRVVEKVVYKLDEEKLEAEKMKITQVQISQLSKTYRSVNRREIAFERNILHHVSQ